MAVNSVAVAIKNKDVNDNEDEDEDEDENKNEDENEDEDEDENENEDEEDDEEDTEALTQMLDHVFSSAKTDDEEVHLHFFELLNQATSGLIPLKDLAVPDNAMNSEELGDLQSELVSKFKVGPKALLPEDTTSFTELNRGIVITEDDNELTAWDKANIVFRSIAAKDVEVAKSTIWIAEKMQNYLYSQQSELPGVSPKLMETNMKDDETYIRYGKYAATYILYMSYPSTEEFNIIDCKVLFDGIDLSKPSFKYFLAVPARDYYVAVSDAYNFPHKLNKNNGKGNKPTFSKKIPKDASSLEWASASALDAYWGNTDRRAEVDEWYGRGEDLLHGFVESDLTDINKAKTFQEIFMVSVMKQKQKP